MMNGKFKMQPYLIVQAAAFYLLPLTIKDTGMAMVVMLAGLPAVCFAVSFILGMKHTLQWRYPFMVAFLFLPTLFIFYNSTAWVYAPGYGMIALAGSWLGGLFHRSNP